MSISLNELSNVQNSGSYYLSDNGEVKKAGAWTRFKYTFNLGHSRERASNLVNEIKDTLTKAADINLNYRLRQRLEDIDVSGGFKGSDIKNLLSEFKTSNEDKILSASARKIAIKLINNTINELCSNPRIVNSPALMEMFLSSCKQITDHPPYEDTENGKELDKETLKNALMGNIASFKEDLEKIMSLPKLENQKINSSYAEYLQKALFDNNGIRIENGIDNVKTMKDAFVHNALNKYISNKEGYSDRIRENAEFIASFFGQSDDLDELLINGVNHLIRGGDAEPRSIDSIRSKIDALKSNLDAISGFKDISAKTYKAAFTSIKTMNGKTFPTDCISKSIELAKAVPLEKLHALNEKSSQLEIYRAISYYADKVSDVIVNSNIMNNIDGADEMDAAKDFAYIALLSSLTSDERKTLLQALNSMNTCKLNKLMDDAFGDKTMFNGSSIEKEMAQVAINEQNTALTHIKRSLETLMGIKHTEISAYIGNLDINSESRTILEDAENTAKKVIDAEIRNFADKSIKGDSAAYIKEQLIRSLKKTVKHSNDLMPPFMAQAAFSVSVSKLVTGKLTKNMIDTVRKCSNNEKTQFEKDLSSIQISLPGGRNLSSDYNIAMDELSVYVTGKENAKYAEIGENDRKKVQIIVSFLSNEYAKVCSDSVSLFLDDKQKAPFFTTSSRGLTQSCEFSLSYDISDSFVVSVKQTSEFSNLFKKDGTLIVVGEGSVQKNELEVTITPNEMDRLAGLDFNNANEDFTIKNTVKSALTMDVK